MAGACKEYLDELRTLIDTHKNIRKNLSSIYKTKGQEAYNDACHLADFEYAKKVYSLREKYGYPNKSEPKLKMR